MPADYEVKTYNVGQVFAQFFGVTITKGVGKTGMAAGGPFIEIEQDGPSFSEKKGIDGSLVVSQTNEPVTKVLVHLMQTSALNAVFSAILNKAIRGTNGDGFGTGAVKDLQGASVFASAMCWIVGPPKRVYGAEGEERVWEIHCAKNEEFEGGN